MNALTLNRPAGLPAAFAGRALPDMNKATQENLAPSFSVVGYKGRNWRIKSRGDEELLKDDRGVPLPVLNVVIVGISPSISKQYYEKRYAEGDDASPDCWSLDGVAPVDASPSKQCATCAACPQNVYGSKITEAGKKAKACQDSRRLAVVPSGDIDNESYGGPMLLRLPPMSLSQLARYGNELARFSAQPFMVETQLGFDYDVAYPLITFKANGWLDDAQAARVASMLDNPLINRMLEIDAGAVDDAASAGQSSALAGGAPAVVFGGAAEVEEKAPAPVPASSHASRSRAAKPASAGAPVPASEPAAQEQAAQEPGPAVQDPEDAEAEAAEAAAMAALEAARARRAAARKPEAAVAAAAPSLAPAVAPAPAATPAVAATVRAAPDDMSKAIDDLLAD